MRTVIGPGWTLQTGSSTGGNTTETLPAAPHSGDSIIAMNLGTAHTYTLVATIDGATNLVLNAGDSAILTYTSNSGWRTSWKSGGGSGTVTDVTASAPLASSGGATPNLTFDSWPTDSAGYLHNDGGGVLTWVDIAVPTFPISVANGGTGADLSGSGLGTIPYFNTGSGDFQTHTDLTFTVFHDELDDATSTLALSATDSNAHTSTVSLGIELPGDGASAGDLVATTALGVLAVFPGASSTDYASYSRILGGLLLPTGDAVVDQLNDPLPPLFIGLGTSAGNVAAYFKSQDATGGSDLVTLGFSASTALVRTYGWFHYQNSGLDDGSSWFGFTGAAADDFSDPVKVWSDGAGSFAGIGAISINDPSGTFPVADVVARDSNFTGLGRAALASIGSGTDGTVNLAAATPGVAGNSFTVEVVVAGGNNAAMAVAYSAPDFTVTLGTDGGGLLDPAKNTATLIAAAAQWAANGVTATASGTGADPLTGAEGPTAFSGGAESITTAGGVNAASFGCAGGFQYVLPATPSAGVLTSDANGVLSWV